ncbi:flavodoxin domain-containing protein [Corynebacterium sp. H128]|uniref:flavodoxin domain-containing protein n=1 Tax=Corynebacterium sp. H128 TaxID=3133427 RepID=UPI0030A56FC7
MALVVAYNTHYGSTKQYAEEFARRHQTIAVPLDQATVADHTVVFSPNYAGQCAGAKWLLNQDLSGMQAALAVVGMTLSEEVRVKDPMAGALGDRADSITRFYLPGRLSYSGLNRVHKATMWTMNKMLAAKKNRSENEEAMLRGYNTDEDRVDFHELDALDAWLKG